MLYFLSLNHIASIFSLQCHSRYLLTRLEKRQHMPGCHVSGDSGASQAEEHSVVPKHQPLHLQLSSWHCNSPGQPSVSRSKTEIHAGVAYIRAKREAAGPGSLSLPKTHFYKKIKFIRLFWIQNDFDSGDFNLVINCLLNFLSSRNMREQSTEGTL